MVLCVPCFDFDLIESILKDDYVWSGISEDGMDKESFIAPSILSYYLFKEDDVVLGVAALRPVSSVCAELHTCLLRKAAGRSKEIFNMFAVWLLDNTMLESLITLIPECNKKAISAALNAGFIKVGVIEDSFMKGGVVHQVLLQVRL